MPISPAVPATCLGGGASCRNSAKSGRFGDRFRVFHRSVGMCSVLGFLRRFQSENRTGGSFGAKRITIGWCHVGPSLKQPETGPGPRSLRAETGRPNGFVSQPPIAWTHRIGGEELGGHSPIHLLPPSTSPSIEACHSPINAPLPKKQKLKHHSLP